MNVGAWRRIAAAALLGGSVVFSFASACEPVPGVPSTLENGKFCLTFDVSISGMPAFTLGKDVVLDCQGHRIKDLGSSYSGVSIQGVNAVIKNCVFEGFRAAITIANTADYPRVLNNTILESPGGAIQSFGRNGLISGNIISARNDVDSHQWLMSTYATTDITHNVILNETAPVVTSYGARYGISSSNNAGGIISRNIVRNVLPAPGKQGLAIHTSLGYEVLYRNLIVAEPGRGDIGMFCSSGNELSVLNTVVGYPNVVGWCVN